MTFLHQKMVCKYVIQNTMACFVVKINEFNLHNSQY